METFQEEGNKEASKLETTSHLSRVYVLVLGALFLVVGATVLFALHFKQGDVKEDNTATDPTSTSTLTHVEKKPVRVLNTKGEELATLPAGTAYYVLPNQKDFRLPFKAPLAEGDFVYDQEENYRFRLAEGWSLTQESPTLPRTSSSSKYMLSNNTKTCFVAAVGEPNYDGYIQGTYRYGFRSAYESQQGIDREIDVQKFVGEINHSTRFSENNHAWIPYEPYEVGIGSGLLLFAPDGTTVTKDCDEAFASMLRTYEPFYEQVVIAPESNGLLAFEFENVPDGALVLQNGMPNIFLRLLFKEHATGIVKQVRTLHAEYSPEPSVYKNFLFYLDRERGVVRQDIYTGVEVVIVSNRAGEDGEVNDFYIYNDRLFYTVGMWCMEYRGGCNSTLYETDMLGNAHTEIARSVTARNIIGYDAKENSLYVQTIDGDAGCVWGTYEKINLLTSEISLVETVNACVEDENGEYINTNTYMENFEERFARQMVIKSQLEIIDGQIVPYEGEWEFENPYPRFRYMFTSL